MFFKAHRLPILVLSATIGLLIAAEVLTPKPIDWTTTYALDDKKPFGSKILYELLPELFPNQPVRVSYRSLYEQKDTLGKANYFFVGDSFAPGDEDVSILLKTVAAGSTAFIATEDLSSALEDTLNCGMRSSFFLSDTVTATLTEPGLRDKRPYQFKKVNRLLGFTVPDSTRPAVFQTLGANSQNKPNFVRIPWGKGWIYLQCLPQAYTNYNMLADRNRDYIEKTLSYLPVQPVYWDEFYKGNIHESKSPLRFLVATPPLRWAMYLTLFTLVLFVLFEAKRRQRIIPVITPLANSTLEFTQTIGKLYYQYRDHKNIADKKITYFLDHLRTQYYVPTLELNDELYDKLVQKTGHPREEIVKLFRLIHYIRSQPKIPEEVLLELNDRVEKFVRPVSPP